MMVSAMMSRHYKSLTSCWVRFTNSGLSSGMKRCGKEIGVMLRYVSLLMYALTLVFLMILSGCSSRGDVKPSAPAELTNQTLIPSYSGETYRDFVEYCSVLRESLEKCNIDKSSLRTFFEKLGE